MNYIVFDLEFNQPFNSNKKKNFTKGLKVEKCQFEIMEIGAVKLDENLQLLDTFRMYVKPNIYKTIHPKVKRITGITEDDLSFGLIYQRVFKYFRSWCGDKNHYVLCSWSYNDLIELQRNCKYYNIYSNLSTKYIDIQEMYSKVKGSNRIYGLDKALVEINIEVDKNKLHTALDDSMYSMKIFKEIYNKETINNHIRDISNFNVKESGVITNYEQLNKSKLKVRCSSCNVFAKRETRWNVGNNKYRIAMGECSKCKNKVLSKYKVTKDVYGDVKYKSKHENITIKTYNANIERFFPTID